MNRRGVATTVLAFASVAAPVAPNAQSLNVDFGQPADAPARTYAAAGLPGVWNSIQGDGVTATVYPLVDLDGRPTGVTLRQFGGTELRSASDPSVSGDDARLMNDAIITFTPLLETCLFVNGLAPGTYEVLTYAWMPSAPAVQSRVRHDLSSTTVDVGGAWTGAHVEGVTYARHTLVIRSDGFMGSHSGIVPGAVAANGAALNGFQLRYLGGVSDAGTDAGPSASDGGRDAARDEGPVAMDAGDPLGADAAVESGDAPQRDAERDSVSPASADAGSMADTASDSARVDGGGGGSGRGCACQVATPRVGDCEGVASLALLAGVALASGRRRRARAWNDPPRRRAGLRALIG